jgi:O-succinylhomoserine sulfhydrylase
MRALFTEEVSGNVHSRYANQHRRVRAQTLPAGRRGRWCRDRLRHVGGVYRDRVACRRETRVASRALVGSTHQIFTRILPQWGDESSYVAAGDQAQWIAGIRPNTRMIFVETPSNPGLELIDLEWLGALARERGVDLVVDNCFATPYLQRPMAFGATAVVHSATKYIDGQGRVLGGAIVGAADFVADCRFFARHTGPAMSAFNAWVLSKSLETLAIRMDRHCANALTVAQHFERHPAVASVRYPFLPSHPQYDLAKRQMSQGGGIVVLVVNGGLEGGRRFLDAVKMVSHSPNLGDSRTIVTHPASTTHSKLTVAERAAVGISDGLVRVSVGLEHADDIIADIDQALTAASR